MIKRLLYLVLLFAALLTGYFLAPAKKPDFSSDFSSARFVDLTHAFYPGIPHGEGLKGEKVETLYSYAPGVGSMGHGALIYYYSFPGQWGTHVDAPAHFIKGKRFLDQIPPQEMLLPLVVLDIHKEVEKNPDYQVSLADVRQWEKRHGPIPKNSFVALRSDWSKRWPDQQKMQNRDKNNISHTPGWSRAVLEFLLQKRHITAIGHETGDTDPGIDASRMKFPLERYFLSHNKYQIELMTNLDKVPESGAMIIASWPKPRHGSGFPARVIAIIPDHR